MTDRQTPSTSGAESRGASNANKETVRLARADVVEPAAVELDLRDHDNGRDLTVAPHELLSRRQAAERFGLDPGILSTWEKAGRLTPCRNTPRGRVYYAVAEVRRAVSEHTLSEHALSEHAMSEHSEPVNGLQQDALEVHGPGVDRLGVDGRKPDDHTPPAGLVLSPERLWVMVEEARRDAVHARTRASALEAEVRLLREMIERLVSEPADASSAPRGGEAAERARRWAGQWDRHEEQQQREQQELSARGSWWSRHPDRESD